MRRVASHFVFWKGWRRMHYVELSDDGQLLGVEPLQEEIAGTEFYDGILLPVVASDTVTLRAARFEYPLDEDPAGCRRAAVNAILSAYHWTLPEPGDKVSLWSLQLSPAEFGTDNGCGNGYIQRL